MRLIIDCDPGNGIAGANVDDGLALALAIAAPELTLELITTVAGNTPSAIGYAVTKQLLERLNLNIPIARGASRALLEPMAPWRERLDHGVDQHGLRSLWQDITPPMVQQETKPIAAQAIGELICRHPGEITLVAIGPLTNIAMAMQLYPELAQSVAEIVIMGGVFNVPGYLKDTNFGLDPEAAHVVLTSGANITLVPMDVTTQTQMLHQDLDRFASYDNPLSQYLAETMRPWMDYSIKTRQLPGCWIHDVLTIAWLIDRQVATVTTDYVDVALAGIARGMTCRYGPEKLRLNVGVADPVGQPVTILHTVDNKRLMAIINQYIQHYQ